ncbi:MAG: DUF192 domain-containing protein [Actinobacteria bacterium]|nr:DUF192 domain-containing protein [Actinomycetota bacterium]
MPVRRFLAIIVVGILATACNGSDQPTEPAGSSGSPSPTTTSGQRAAALIDTAEGSVLFEVEVARTDEEKEVGLMGRESLPEDRGMAFVFFEPTAGGFWMKDTLIPLSIAFVGSDGIIQEILDMEPCTEENCPIYTPAEPYALALEVNKGAFDRTGVDAGDRVTISF